MAPAGTFCTPHPALLKSSQAPLSLLVVFLVSPFGKERAYIFHFSRPLPTPRSLLRLSTLWPPQLGF